jgi:membrane protein DedA with SNARE-associated domain
MKPELQALVASAVRWGIAFAAGYVGVEVVQDQVNTAAGWIAAIIIAAGSLWWSKATVKKVVETAKPTNGGAL